MRKVYWFYDVSVGVFEDREVIWIWALDFDGNKHVLIDRSFKNFFYIDTRRVDEKSLWRDIESMLSGSEVKGIKIERVNLKYYGKEKSLYKVSGDDVSIKKLIQEFRKKYGERNLYEDDIRFTTKYHIYMGLNPCSWYEFDTDFVYEEKGVRFEILNKILGEREESQYPKFRILALDTIITSRYGEPDPKKDPINYVVIFDGEDFDEFIIGESDYNILKAFDNYVDEVDPHIIVTLGGNSFIWPYLVNRTRFHGVGLSIGTLDIDIHQSLYGHTSIAGRIHIDLKEYIDDLPFLQRKTLEELSFYLGLEGYSEPIDDLQYYYFWIRDRDKLINYVKWRVMTIYRSFELLKEHFFNLSNITGIPPDYVVTASSGRQAEYYIMRRAVELGEVIPKVVVRRFKTYPGGLVLKPKKGLHENVAVIDYKSMYPNLIMKYNISPDTITREEGENINFYADLGVGVRLDVEGLFPVIARRLVKERDDIRRLMSGLDRDSPEYRLFDARQRVLKILANTLYGYMGWLGARWYSWKGASLITFLGRKVINQSLEKAVELGLDVLYGDTDSLFVKYVPEKIDGFLRWINEDLGLEAKVDKIYSKLLFTEAKKRYAGLTLDGYIDVVGLEYVRRDWCEFAKESQYVLLNMVLTGRGKRFVLDEFRRRVDMLRKRKVSLSKLVIWEQITRALDEYKANAPHIAVAAKLESMGWRIKKGVFIGYAIHVGEGPLYKRAVHHLDADLEKLDMEYYIFNQLIPVVERVVEPLSISKETLESLAKGSGLGLDAFIGGI